ncbi:hypothetical protein D3C76_1067230 [compost metagenome]
MADDQFAGALGSDQHGHVEYVEMGRDTLAHVVEVDQAGPRMISVVSRARAFVRIRKQVAGHGVTVIVPIRTGFDVPQFAQ